MVCTAKDSSTRISRATRNHMKEEAKPRKSRGRKRYRDCTVPGWVVYLRETCSAYERLIVLKVRSSADVATLVGPRLAEELVEVMVVVALDAKNHVIAMHEVARGGVSQCGGVTPADVLR